MIDIVIAVASPCWIKNPWGSLRAQGLLFSCHSCEAWHAGRQQLMVWNAALLRLQL